MAFSNGLEVFGNCSSCVIGTNGYAGSATADTPASGTSESWTMSTGYGSFPAAQTSAVPNTYFYIRDPADTTNEMVQVTVGGGTGTGWTVIRGACGTVPVTHAAGATWVQVIAPGTLQNFKQASNASTGNITLASSTTETVIASYTPLATDIVSGASFEIIAFGQFGKALGVALPTLQWTIYWGGSGSPGSAFTATGSQMVAQILTGTNAPPFLTTIAAAGNGFDVNGTLTLESSVLATCNMNWWYNNAVSLATTASNAVTNNTNGSHQSTAAPITISGSGPIILTAKWSVSSASNTLTATAPLIYRAA